MDCNEVKNLILESKNLKSLKSNSQVSLHFQNCKSCQEKLLLETKIREGFQTIADQSPPPQLFERIMAIQKQEVIKPPTEKSLLRQLTDLVNNFTVRVAFASALTGFCAAIIFNWNSTGRYKIPEQKTFSKTTQDFSSPKTSPQKSKSIKTYADDSEVSFSNEGLIDSQKNKDFKIALKNKKSAPMRAINKLDSFKSESKPELEEIPGAVTFSLKEERSSAPSAQMHVGNSRKIAGPEPETAMQDSSSESDKMIIALAPSESSFAESIETESSPKLRKKAKLIISNGNKLSTKNRVLASRMADSFEANDDIAEEKVSPTQSRQKENEKARKIEKIIHNNFLTPSNEFISLEEWVIQGIISKQEEKLLAPPAGKKWFAVKENEVYKIEAR